MECTGRVTSLRAGQGGGGEFSMEKVDMRYGSVEWAVGYKSGESGLKKHV